MSNEYSKQEKNRMTGRGEPDFEGLIQSLRSEEGKPSETREEYSEQPLVRNEPEGATSRPAASPKFAEEPLKPVVSPGLEETLEETQLSWDTPPKPEEGKTIESKEIWEQIQAALDVWEPPAAQPELGTMERTLPQEKRAQERSRSEDPVDGEALLDASVEEPALDVYQRDAFQSGQIITLNLRRRERSTRNTVQPSAPEEQTEDGPDLLPELTAAPEQPIQTETVEVKSPEEEVRPEEKPEARDEPLPELEAPEWWEKLAELPESKAELPLQTEGAEEPSIRFVTLNLRRTDLQTGPSEPSKAFDQDEEESLEAMLEANARAARQRRAEAQAKAEAEWDAVLEESSVRKPSEPEPPEEDASEAGELPEEPELPEELETPEPGEMAPEAPQPGEPGADIREEEPREPEQPEKAAEPPAPEDEAFEDDDSPDEAELEAPERGPNAFQRLAAALMERLSRRQTEEPEEAAFEEKKTEPRKKARPTPEKVIELPKEQPSGLIQKKLAEMDSWADEFADAMFRSDSEEAKEEEKAFRKAERLIPATDEEREPRRTVRKEKPVKEKKPVRRAPDTSPKELYRMFSSSYKSGRSRLPFQLVIALALLAVTALAGNEVPVVQVPVLAEHLKVTGIVLVLGLLGASALGLDILLEGIVRLFRGRPGLNTLSSIGVLFTLIDGLWYATLGREGPLPFCGFAALSLWAVAWGSCKKKQGLRDACEDAYCRSQFERLTMDPGKWDGKGAFLKEPGSVKGFGSQIQEPDGAERVYRYATPVMMLASLMFGILSVIGQKNPQQLVWSWSVIFILAAPLSATLAYGLPYSKLVRRLHRSGAILAGWEGADSMQGDVGIVLTDRDLFPEGAVQLNGIHNFGEVSLEKLTGCTASIIRAADVGLAKIFDDQIRIQGGFYRRVDDLKCTDEGGYTGLIRGDQVIIGTADYLTMLGIEISPGHQVKNAVFCVINGRLQGIFALNYVLPRTVRPTLNALIGGKIHPILALRDFNLTPEMLQRRFKLPAERLQYPPVERRHEFSAKGQPHSETLGALIFREGIVPYADAILGGRRLRTVVRINRFLSVAASAVGALLGFYLTMMNAYASLSLANILFFLVMWLIPTLLVSNGVDKF